MKAFTKKDLINKLGYSQEETKLIMEAQKMFPELLTVDNDTEGFVIDARNLWRQLGEPTGQFSKWIDRKLVSKSLGKDEKDIPMFIENKDYEIYVNENRKRVDKNVYLEQQGIAGLDAKKISQLGGSIEYVLTLDCAKNVSMMENTSKGQLCRRYFILMEKAVKKMTDWTIIREPQKDGFKEMCKMLDMEYQDTHNGEKPNPFLYSNNADMLNLCLLGMKSKKAKTVLDVKYNEPLRENLTQEYNRALYELQVLNGNLLLSHIDFQTRKMIIDNTCKSKYFNLRIRISSEFAEEFKKIKE